MTTAAATPVPVPVAFLGRTSTLTMQDPVQSLGRQLREVKAKLPPGWFLAAHYWDIESGGMDLDQRGHGTAHLSVDADIPRDGGIADLLAEAARPEPRFAAVMCEDIERSGRDTFDALRLEKHLSGAGIPLLATDEPIDVGGMNATTLLVRRVKQGIAEWYRFQLKDKAWKGLREHALAGYNIGPVPYGYTAERIPHPVPAKAAQGATKTRLVLDPDRVPAVAQIFAWRTQDRVGRKTIVARLAADPTVPLPPSGQWTVSAVSRILANPKYTGYMVFGRQRTINGKMTAVPPSEWLWSPESTHPAIITRETFEDAQKVGAEHSTSRDGDGPSTHPAARRTYALRGRIHHRTCHRRMHGTTRPSSRYYTGGPDNQLTYYLCPHDPTRAAAPEAEAHPRTVSLREDLITLVLSNFFDNSVFGPERRALLEKQFPAGAAEQAARDQATTDALNLRLRQIEAAENAYAHEIEALAETAAAPAAVTALRTRILARFTELEEERAAIGDRLARLGRDRQAAPDLELLDLLPIIAGLMNLMPARLHARLYDVFGIEVLYRHDLHQVTIHATLTTSTPGALADLIRLCDNPTPTLTAALSDLERNPGTPETHRDHERGPDWGARPAGSGDSW